MSRFGENVVDLLWAVGEGFIDRLKSLSSSMVEDDEYVLIFFLFLVVPTLIVMAFVARCIRRAHNRVRYASEYVEQNPYAFITSSSSASDSSSSDEAEGSQAAAKQYTMEEVFSVARKLTEQETMQRRNARRAETARAAAAAAANAPSASLSAPVSETQSSDKKNDWRL